MSFIVIDNRRGRADDKSGEVLIFPYSLEQAHLRSSEESIWFEENRAVKYRQHQQADHTEFANSWLRNLRNQGFLSAGPETTRQ